MDTTREHNDKHTKTNHKPLKGGEKVKRHKHYIVYQTKYAFMGYFHKKTLWADYDIIDEKKLCTDGISAKWLTLTS